MKRADVEAAARVIAQAEGVLFSPRSECTDSERRSLRDYETRAENALAAIRCSLMGAECTCWTNERLIAAAHGATT